MLVYMLPFLFAKCVKSLVPVCQLVAALVLNLLPFIGFSGPIGKCNLKRTTHGSTIS